MPTVRVEMKCQSWSEHNRRGEYFSYSLTFRGPFRS